MLVILQAFRSGWTRSSQWMTAWKFPKIR